MASASWATLARACWLLATGSTATAPAACDAGHAAMGRQAAEANSLVLLQRNVQVHSLEARAYGLRSSLPECQDTSLGALTADETSTCDAQFNPEWCGLYDDSDFSSNDMCCACGGGVPPTCLDSNLTARTADNSTTCRNFNQDWCGLYDDSDFSSMDMCCACGGGKEPSCKDLAHGALTADGLSTCDADFNPEWCGQYDDSDFSSNTMCCACGGGSIPIKPTCTDTLTWNGTGPAFAADGIQTCSEDGNFTMEQKAMQYNPAWCGLYDDSDFSSNEMCCVCGGGVWWPPE